MLDPNNIQRRNIFHLKKIRHTGYLGIQYDFYIRNNFFLLRIHKIDNKYKMNLYEIG